MLFTSGAENDEGHRLYSCFMNIFRVSNSSYFFFVHLRLHSASFTNAVSLFYQYILLLGAPSPKPRDTSLHVGRPEMRLLEN